MGVAQEPIPGCYYVSLSGQMMNVRALLYAGETRERVAVEYLDGRVAYLAACEWDRVVVARYTDWLDGVEEQLDREQEQ